MAYRADPDQTAPKEQSDQGLHCLLKYICPHNLIIMVKVHVNCMFSCIIRSELKTFLKS